MVQDLCTVLCVCAYVCVSPESLTFRLVAPVTDEPNCQSWWRIINRMNKARTARPSFYKEEDSVVFSICEVQKARPPRADPHSMQTTLIFYYYRDIKIESIWTLKWIVQDGRFKVFYPPCKGLELNVCFLDLPKVLYRPPFFIASTNCFP